MKKLGMMFISMMLLLYFLPFLLIEKSPEPVNFEQPLAHCPFDITVAGMDEPLSIEDYVIGVVAAEMPATFHEEALKAQALAARTYALKTTANGKQPIAGDVSAQVYYSKKKRKENWGKNFEKKEKIITDAVEKTAGEVILFNDELISAMFFSTSNGQTETAKNYGGTDIPYLQSVMSTGEEALTTVEQETEEMPLAKWNAAFNLTWDAERFESLQLVRNSSGRVQKVVATDFEKGGREVRELLGLRSTDFNIAFDVTNEVVLIQTVGYGHGVGMSQYGAEALAQEGMSAHDIIAHYYTGTATKKILINDPVCLKQP